MSNWCQWCQASLSERKVYYEDGQCDTLFSAVHGSTLLHSAGAASGAFNKLAFFPQDDSGQVVAMDTEEVDTKAGLTPSPKKDILSRHQADLACGESLGDLGDGSKLGSEEWKANFADQFNKANMELDEEEAKQATAAPAPEEGTSGADSSEFFEQVLMSLTLAVQPSRSLREPGARSWPAVRLEAARLVCAPSRVARSFRPWSDSSQRAVWRVCAVRAVTVPFCRHGAWSFPSERTKHTRPVSMYGILWTVQVTLKSQVTP